VDKRKQIQYEAKKQFFDACALLYQRGASTLRDFSLRKIREAKIELFGTGGKFTLAQKYRDEWLKNNGFSDILPSEEEGGSESNETISEPKNPLLYSAFEKFIVTQAEVVAGQIKEDLEAKVEELTKENTALTDDYRKLKEAYEKQQKELISATASSDCATYLPKDMIAVFESNAELKLALKVAQEEREKAINDARKALLDCEKAEGLLESAQGKSNELEAKRLDLYNKNQKLDGILHKSRVDKAQLEIKYRDAVYDLSFVQKDLDNERRLRRNLEKRVDEMLSKLQLRND